LTGRAGARCTEAPWRAGGLPSRRDGSEQPAPEPDAYRPPGGFAGRQCCSPLQYLAPRGRNFGGREDRGEVAVQSAVFTEVGCERIIRFAFDLARTRPRKKVSSVTKSNAQQYGMVLWDDVFTRVAADYPDVETESVLVDAMSAKFVLRPEDLSVVVASNLNADILSDLGSALAGSLGLAASANLNPERRFPSMFEPVHGSAPDIAGQGICNPVGAIGSAALMLEHFGLHDEAKAVQHAIEVTSGQGIAPATSADPPPPRRSPRPSSGTCSSDSRSSGEPSAHTGSRASPCGHGLRRVRGHRAHPPAVTAGHNQRGHRCGPSANTALPTATAR
jgi:hypothetical protein